MENIHIATISFSVLCSNYSWVHWYNVSRLFYISRTEAVECIFIHLFAGVIECRPYRFFVILFHPPANVASVLVLFVVFRDHFSILGYR